MKSPIEPLLKVEEVAAILRVSGRTIYRMVEEGDLPYVALSRGPIRFNRGDIERWLAANTHATNVGISQETS